jgi:hypothetical protein
LRDFKSTSPKFNATKKHLPPNPKLSQHKPHKNVSPRHFITEPSKTPEQTPSNLEESVYAMKRVHPKATLKQRKARKGKSPQTPKSSGRSKLPN